jgi:K+-transporting ATPase ATPase C chain
MKQYIIPALRLTLTSILVFAVAYTLVVLGIAQVAPNHGGGELVKVNGKTVGYKIQGQLFTRDDYFNGRPSAVNYNAAGSGGSNKGPSNPDYLQQVKDRIDSFLVHNPGIKKQDIPAELVTASASGLDPDISPEAAYVQTARIARIRKIPEGRLRALINRQVQKPLLGVLGTKKVNVLRLNIELDKLN